jgi:predicted nucleic acid-binding protein
VSAQDDPAFLDTSYVVRYLTNSPPAMAAQAARVIDSDEPLVLTESILLETAFVLGGSIYKIPREGIVDALAALVQRRNIHLPVLSKPRALEALELCRNSKRYSFTDALLWAQALEAGVGRRIYSFDGRFPSRGITIVGDERA